MNEHIINKLSEMVTGYEVKYNGGLIHGYMNIPDFETDVKEELKYNGVDELLGYYNTYLASSNDTNSTEDQRKELNDIILVLQGQE